MTDDEIDAAWSRHVAAFAISGLMAAKIIADGDQERATDIAAEEIYVRLAPRDRPDQENWRYASK